MNLSVVSLQQTEEKSRVYVSLSLQLHAHPFPSTASHGKTIALFVYQTCSCGILISDIWYIDVLAVTISVASAAVGFLCGASARHERKSRGQVEPPSAVPNPKERDGHDSSDDEDATADGDLSTVAAGLLQPCKLVRLSALSTHS